jgi:EAL domain-containing protein (putative c-di-GMP-specific phosphodiesterase class I)
MNGFGSANSSLTRLQSFPFAKIKIDSSVIQGLSENPESLSMTRCIVSLAGNLCMVATADGVATQDQLAQVRLEGCTEAQGEVFGRARSAEDACLMADPYLQRESVMPSSVHDHPVSSMFRLSRPESPVSGVG